jgi:hypothetical protein
MDRLRRQSEIDFFKIFKNAEWSSENEDMFDHIDVKIGDITVDVKGIKRYSMKDAEANPEIHWVEFQNVNGQKGWMYGKADYIAFELVNEFLLIKREDLYNFCKEKIVDRKVKDTKGFYTLYSRKGCKDVLSLVLTEDLLKLPNKIVRKDSSYDTEKDFFQSDFSS